VLRSTSASFTFFASDRMQLFVLNSTDGQNAASRSSANHQLPISLNGVQLASNQDRHSALGLFLLMLVRPSFDKLPIALSTSLAAALTHTKLCTKMNSYDTYPFILACGQVPDAPIIYNSSYSGMIHSY